MAIKLSSNPTCVLSDADNITLEQRKKINMNLTKGIPGSDIEGDKVTVISSDGEVEMKAYSTGGDEVPDVTSNDDGKVLTASYSGGVGSYAWATPAAGGGFSPTLVAQRLYANKSTSGASFDGSTLLTPGLTGVPSSTETIPAGWYVATVDCTTEGSYTWGTGVPHTFNFELVVTDEGPEPTVNTGNAMPVSYNGEDWGSRGSVLFYLSGSRELYYFKARVAAPSDANFSDMYLTVKLYKL